MKAMGCNSSHAVAPVRRNSEYVVYSGFGNDYVNYSYYQSYLSEESDQQDWTDYYKVLEYQKDQSENADEEPKNDAFNQYKHWHEHQPHKQKQYSPENTPEYGVTGTDGSDEVVIDLSSTDVKQTDERDCVADEPIALRMGLKTIGTALRITIIKKQPACMQGPNQLKVTVLDTIRSRRPSLGFLTRRPRLEPDQKFVDGEFLQNEALGKYAKGLDWKRPQDIYGDKEICLFHEGTSLDDVDQGQFGTCYFLAILGGLASQPEVMKQIILPDAYNIKCGVFHCRFWRVGQWIDVYTDDYLPCDSQGLVGCKSNNYVGEMWVPLMEKAYAKFMGSYPKMENGIPRDAYLALTGGCAEWLALSYYEFDSGAVYSRLATALSHGSVVVCSTTPQSEESKASMERKGVVINHAYTVTATAVVERNEGIQESLVKLRNPWAHKEWTGAWGDHSDEWYSVNKLQRDQLREIEDNGEFWMPWTEFWGIFTDITVCSISPDYDFDGASDGLDNVFCIYGEWKGDLTGGWQEIERNPTYEFAVPKGAKTPVNIVIEGIQKLAPKVYKTTAGNVLLRDANSTSIDAEYMGPDTTTYTTSNPLTRRFAVKPGGKYQIIPTKYEAGEEGSFLLRIFSKLPLDIKPVKRKGTARA